MNLCPLTNLPCDIFQHILSYLSFHEIVCYFDNAITNISLRSHYLQALQQYLCGRKENMTCKSLLVRWLLSRNILLTSINFDNFDEEGIIYINRYRDSLKSISFQGTLHLKNFILLGKFSSLSSLQILNCGRLSTKSVITVLKENPQLKSLSLNRGRKLTNEVISAIVQYCQGLESLDLFLNPWVNNDTLDILFSGCPRLSELDVRLTRVDDSSIPNIIAQTPRLSFVRFDVSPVSVPNLLHIIHQILIPALSSDNSRRTLYGFEWLERCLVNSRSRRNIIAQSLYDFGILPRVNQLLYSNKLDISVTALKFLFEWTQSIDIISLMGGHVNAEFIHRLRYFLCSAPMKMMKYVVPICLSATAMNEEFKKLLYTDLVSELFNAYHSTICSAVEILELLDLFHDLSLPEVTFILDNLLDAMSTDVKCIGPFQLCLNSSSCHLTQSLIDTRAVPRILVLCAKKLGHQDCEYLTLLHNMSRNDSYQISIDLESLQIITDLWNQIENKGLSPDYYFTQIIANICNMSDDEHVIQSDLVATLIRGNMYGSREVLLKIFEKAMNTSNQGLLKHFLKSNIFSKFIHVLITHSTANESRISSMWKPFVDAIQYMMRIEPIYIQQVKEMDIQQSLRTTLLKGFEQNSKKRSASS